MRKGFFLLIIVLLMVIGVGCNNQETISKTIDTPNQSNDNQNQKDTDVDSKVNKDTQVSPTDKENDEGNQSSEQEEQVTKYVAPLTGLSVDHEIKERIVGVMINNHRKARPQSGLNQADLVYEILAEGPITRFIAIYQTNSPKLVGPVRSIRPYYLDIINGFDAIIAHAGSSQAALETLQSNPLPDLDEIENAGTAFWRVKYREMPHNLYTSIESLRKFAYRKGYRSYGYTPSIKFVEKLDKTNLESVKRIAITYDETYKVSYSFDDKSGQYLRFVNGKPHVDAETKEQLTAKNLFIIQAKHKVIDNEGRREIDVNGPDKGYLFQDGVMKEVAWEKLDGMIRPYINGKEQEFLPGQTWTIVVPRLADVSYE